ncbi:MAG: ABC transporter ATP-binding protein [Mesorhizobium sp.]|nr:MAG: ABC transporter ATP-binding protein [Mesorhizobium sp.]TJW66897.1 MAG: ABC transporter ATP-binding protein [Mesorhizobium sp.]
MSAAVKPCLEIRSLSAVLPNGQRVLRSVSLSVQPGEVRALVGESGAGKTMIGKAVLGVLPSSVRVIEGEMRLEGEDLGALQLKARRNLIGARTALIPQDPLTALNPSRRIGPQTTDRLVRILGWSGERADQRIRQLLDEVHIRDPERVLRSYPHELSGGMRQRLQIARNLVTGPRLVFMDEPTGGLDVSVQARLLDLLRGLVTDLGLAAIVVTHDLAVARLLSQRMMVMKDGHVVESGLTDRVLDDPRAPYTQLLVSSILQV